MLKVVSKGRVVDTCLLVTFRHCLLGKLPTFSQHCFPIIFYFLLKDVKSTFLIGERASQDNYSFPREQEESVKRIRLSLLFVVFTGPKEV